MGIFSCFCCHLIFFKIIFFKKIFQKHYPSVNKFGCISCPTLCLSFVYKKEGWSMRDSINRYVHLKEEVTASKEEAIRMAIFSANVSRFTIASDPVNTW